MKFRRVISGVTGTVMIFPLISMTVLAADSSGVTIDKNHFPSEIMRVYLSSEYDANSDGILNDSELKKIVELCDYDIWTTLHDKKILGEDSNWGSEWSWEGIEYLIYLKRIEFGELSDNIKNLDVSKNQKLEDLDIWAGMSLESLDLSKNIALKKLTIGSEAFGGSEITSLDLSNNINLEYLDIGRNPITEVDVSNLTNLKHLELSRMTGGGATYSEYGLKKLDVSNCINLEYLGLQCNSLSTIDLTYNTNLKALSIGGNKLSSIDVSNMPNLEVLYCQDNELTELDLSNNSKLKELSCGWQNMKNIDVSFCHELESLMCVDAGMKVLDLSNNPKLKFLLCYDNNIDELNISNCKELTKVYQNEKASDGGYYGGKKDYSEYVLYSSGVQEGEFYYRTLSMLNFDKSTKIITNKPIASTKPSAVDTAVASFAERLYTCALGRDSEKAGKDYWSNALSHGTSGADAAFGFLFSPEVTNANLTDDAFVNRIYATLMDRQPAAEETAYWVGCIKDGTMTREDVFQGFVNSPEWANVCVTYGIVSGGMANPTIEVKPSYSIINFATRLYTTCLGREADPAGLRYWAGELANLRITGSSAAMAYFFSEEFVNAKVSDREFVNRLYLTFMDRTAGEPEFDYWLGEMNKGMTREAVFGGFAGSEEFGNICADYGIIR